MFALASVEPVAIIGLLHKKILSGLIIQAVGRILG